MTALPPDSPQSRPPTPPAAPAYPVPLPANPKATWSLALGVGSFLGACLCGLPGIVAGGVAILLGHRARAEITRPSDAAITGAAQTWEPTQSGLGQATAGIVCGIVGTAFSVLLLAAWVWALTY